MYQFAIVALLALAVVKLVDFIDGAIPALSGFRSLFAFAIIAVTSDDPANSFGVAGAFCPARCCASVAEDTRTMIVPSTYARMPSSFVTWAVPHHTPAVAPARPLLR